MRLLVIGSEGFIGRHLVQHFAASHEVWMADILDTDKDRYHRISADDPDYYKIFRLVSFDICINASGSAQVRNSFTDPLNDFRKNTANVLLMLEAIRLHNPSCKFINFSSAAVYGFNDTELLTENAPPNPASPYGHHKLMAEQICLEYHQIHKLATCSTRLFSVYGEGQRNLLFWDIWNKYLANKEEISLFGSGMEERDYIYIKDLCAALELIIEQHPFDGSTINVANSKGISIRTAAETFFSILQPSMKISFSGQAKKGDPTHLVSDNSKLAALGYQPRFSFKQGMENYISWLKENQ